MEGIIDNAKVTNMKYNEKVRLHIGFQSFDVFAGLFADFDERDGDFKDSQTAVCERRIAACALPFAAAIDEQVRSLPCVQSQVDGRSP